MQKDAYTERKYHGNVSDGMRIHRSHWVAFDAVEALEREGAKLLVKMRGGAVLPVSRMCR